MTVLIREMLNRAEYYYLRGDIAKAYALMEQAEIFIAAERR